MKKRKLKIAGLCLAAIVLIVVAWESHIYRQTFQYKLKSLTSVPSRSSLEEMLGKPDGVTYPTPSAGSGLFIAEYLPGRESQPPSTIFTYSGPRRLRMRWSREFPFVRTSYSEKYTFVHIYRKDKMAYANQLNKDYPWFAPGFHHAIVRLDAESSGDLRTRTEQAGKGKQ